MTLRLISVGEETFLLSFRESRKLTQSQNYEAEGSSWYSSALILANVVLGVGLLNFPAAFRDAGGISTAMIIQMLCVVCIILGLIANAHCADLSGSYTMHGMVEHYGGPVALFVCNAFIFIHNFGTCVMLLVIIADQIDRTVSVVYGLTFCHQWFLSRSVTLTACSVVLILPTCFPKRIDSFTIGSIIGILTTFYLIGLVLYKYLDLTEEVPVQTSPRHWMDVLKVLPTICFSFEGHIEAVPLYACMAKRNIREFTKTALAATLVCFLIYSSVGIFGYLGCGIYVNSDILTSYSPFDAPIIIGMVFAALKAITSYPIIFFCARIVVLDIWKSRIDPFDEPHGFWTEDRRKNCATVALFMATLLVALYVPTIGSIIALLGGSAALFIFIVPGLCVLQAYNKPRSYKEMTMLIFAALFVFFGTFIAASTTVQSVQRFMDGEFGQYDVTCSSD